MPGKNSDVGIRLSADGADEVRAALRSLGPEGEKMAQRLLGAGKDASKGLLAINAAANEVKDRARGLTDELGPLGGVLRSVGPTGLIFGASLGAIALGASKAFEQAKKGMEFADAVTSASERLRIGVEALQEYRLALTVVGGEGADFDSGLSSLLQKMGELDRTGGGGKAAGVFKELGLSVRNANGDMKTGEEMLGEIIAKVSGLGSAAQQADIARKLFGDQGNNFINLIQKGSDGVARLREEMRATGAVMAANVVNRFAELEAIAKPLSQTLDVQLMSAFVDLAPVLVDGAKLWAGLAQSIGWARDNIVDIENRSTDRLKATLDVMQARRDYLSHADPTETRTFDGAVIVDDHKQEMADLDEKIARAREELKIRDALSKPKPAPSADDTGGTELPSGISDTASKDTDTLKRLQDEIANYGNERKKFVDSQMASLSKDATPQLRASTEEAANALFDLNQEKAIGNKLDEESQRIQKEGEAITKSVMNDREKLTALEADLNLKRASGAISQETYTRALQKGYEQYDPAIKLSKELADTIAEAGINAASSIHNIDDLVDAVQELGQQILKMILNTVAYAPLQAGIQAGLSSFMPSIFGSASVRHAGGIGMGGPSRSLPASMFMQAPRFHNGIGPNEMAAIITKDEGVFTPRQMDNADSLLRGVFSMAGALAAGGGKGEMNVRIFKQPGTDVDVAQGRDAGGAPTLDVTVRKVASMMAADIGTGRSPINGAMEARYPALKNARALPRNG